MYLMKKKQQQQHLMGIDVPEHCAQQSALRSSTLQTDALKFQEAFSLIIYIMFRLKEGGKKTKSGMLYIYCQC